MNAEPEPAAFRVESAPTPGRASRPLVWVVDDSPLEGETSRRMLADHFDVEVFVEPDVLLEQLVLGTQPQTLVLDWNMPVLSGFDVCTFIRRTFDRSQLPILILTATKDEEVVVSGLSAGGNDFVAKPCSAPELVARVGALVERKAMSDQLKIEAAIRERFIGVLGHDLRQPLNTFVIGTRALMGGPLDEREHRTLGRLASAADRMQRMIGDMLDLTRCRVGGGMPIARRRLDLGALCQRAVEEMRGGHPAAAITLDASGDATGQFDGDRVIQMITNLLANAFDHGDAARPIDVRVHGRERDVLLSLENKGTPIPPSLLANLFDPFRRGRETASTGLGLGLFIVREIVLGHEGSIRVESDEVSTRFSITLPKQPLSRIAGPATRPRPT